MPKTKDYMGRKLAAERAIGRAETASRATRFTNPKESVEQGVAARTRAKAVYGTTTGLTGADKWQESARIASKVERARRAYKPK